MRKVQSFILEGKEIFIGLEDSKRTWKICVRCNRMVVHQTNMPADYENLRRYLQRGYPRCAINLMYEAGFAGFWLHDRLVADGINCIVTPAHTVTQEKVHPVKTDRVDALRLATNLENGDYRRCFIPDEELRQDRQISRTMNQIQRDIVRTKNRIRKFLDFNGLNGQLPPGRWNSSHYKRLRFLPLTEPLQISLGAHLRELEHLEKCRAKLKVALKVLCTKERYREAVRIKNSCPGIGWLSAIRFTVEWGEMSRFPTGQHLASFVGLTSREYSTGETIRRGRITRQGNGQVRAWLIQCAWRALKYDPVLLDKFDRVWHNSGSKKKAIVAVARKLAVRIRALEMANQSYQVGVVQ